MAEGVEEAPSALARVRTSRAPRTRKLELEVEVEVMVEKR